MKPVFFAVGGTGGHLNPAIALKKKMKEEVWFVGAHLSSLKEEGKCIEVMSGTFSKKPFKLFLGFFQSLWFCIRHRPKMVVGFGSYHSLPVAFAAIFLRIPLYLYEYNLRAGLANRWLSRFAVSSGAVFEKSVRDLKGSVNLVAPLLHHAKKVSREESAEYFDLDPSQKTLLIFGGSQGASFLGRLVREKLMIFPKWQVIHLIGKRENLSELMQLYKAAGLRYALRHYEKRMECAWTLADLALCRAGAGTICEALAFTTPALFVPYPHAKGHQKANALFMEEIGGGKCIEQSAGVDAIGSAFIEMMGDEKGLEKMECCLEKHTHRQQQFHEVLYDRG